MLSRNAKKQIALQNSDVSEIWEASMFISDLGIYLLIFPYFLNSNTSNYYDVIFFYYNKFASRSESSQWKYTTQVLKSNFINTNCV